MTLPETILLAAYKAMRNMPIIHTSDLIVLAWMEDSPMFGLECFATKFPDSNRVMACMFGRQMRAKGWFKAVAPKVWALTERGLEAAKRLLQPPPSKPIKEVKPVKPERILSTAQEDEARHLFESIAYNDWAAGERDHKLWKAKAFWGINGNASEVNPRLDATAQVIDSLRRSLAGREAVLKGGLTIADKDLESVSTMHQWMLERFRKELILLRQGKAVPS